MGWQGDDNVGKGQNIYNVISTDEAVAEFRKKMAEVEASFAVEKEKFMADVSALREEIDGLASQKENLQNEVNSAFAERERIVSAKEHEAEQKILEAQNVLNDAKDSAKKSASECQSERAAIVVLRNNVERELDMASKIEDDLSKKVDDVSAIFKTVSEGLTNAKDKINSILKDKK